MDVHTPQMIGFTALWRGLGSRLVGSPMLDPGPTKPALAALLVASFSWEHGEMMMI
jgi:hypothetical protein